MKKHKILFLFYLLVSFSANSQYWKEIPNRCNVDHKCTARVHHDDFENSDLLVAGSSAEIGSGKTGGIVSIMFKKHITKEDTKYYAEFTGDSEGCTSSGRSNVMVLFSDGEKIVLQSVDKLRCGSNSIVVLLTENDILNLSNKNVSKIRMNFTDDSRDFAAKEKQILKVKDLLSCTISTKI